MSVWAIYLEHEFIDNIDRLLFTVKHGNVPIYVSDAIEKYKESFKDANENCYLYAEFSIKQEMHTDDLVWVGDNCKGKYALGRVTKDYPCNMPEKFSVEDILRTPGYDWYEIDSENALPKEFFGSPVAPITVIRIKDETIRKSLKMAYNKKSSGYKYNLDEPSDEQDYC